MCSKLDADYFVARAAQHEELADRTVSSEARKVLRELSESYTSRAAALVGIASRART